jgi:transposase
LHKRALLKETAAVVAAVVAPPVTAPPVSAMYPSKRRHPQPQAWKQRLEEDSARRHERYVAAYEAVRALHAKGADIARTIGVSRRTVYRYLRMDGPPERRHPVHRPRPARLAWEAFVTRCWDEGCHNGRRLWREAREAGHTCSESNVARFVAQLRRGLPRRLPHTAGRPLTNAQGPRARHVALLLLRRPDRLTQEQAAYLEELRRRDPSVATACTLAQDFAYMVRERQGERLDGWVAQAMASEVAEVGRFAHGLAGDGAAVRAGLSLEDSNGQVEGQITKIKLVRRSMYGRGKFDLLERRVLAAA